jgi:hypothetical protein
MTVTMPIVGLLLVCGGLAVMYWLGYTVGASRRAADPRGDKEVMALRLTILDDAAPDDRAGENTVRTLVGLPDKPEPDLKGHPANTRTQD